MAAAIRQKTRGTRRGIIAIFFAMLLAAAPTSQPVQQVRAWFDQLSDPDASVREAAKENLMGLSMNDIPMLQKIVEESRPLRPSQKAMLRGIVTQIFISGISYTPNPADKPFVGLARFDEVTEHSPDGLVVPTRVPGFAAYRMLRDGDLITGIKERPGEHYLDMTSFGAAIGGFNSHQKITLDIVRDGKPMRVPIQLRPQPLGAQTLEGMRIWIDQQQAEADAYWNQNFAPIMDDAVS